MRDHRSLEAWKAARQVTLLVLRAGKRHWQPWSGALLRQLQRASLSVQLNIAGGASFGRSPTYARHLGIAYGWLVETIDLLDLVLAEEALPSDVAVEIKSHADQCRGLLLGLLKRHRPMA